MFNEPIVDKAVTSENSHCHCLEAICSTYIALARAVFGTK